LPPPPNATESWQFDDENSTSTTLVGDAIVNASGGLNGTAVSLDGDYDYIETTSTNSTTNISEMVISSWVKPDYSSGSAEFTVVSKAESFVLSINNIVTPEKIAKFSVFDGIKWTIVQSNSTIPEEWTHLTASFNKTTIAIYVNGILEASSTLDGIPEISSSGELELTTIDQITSENDVIIGASLTLDSSTPYNMFSGLIDGVLFFDTDLLPLEIAQIYSQNYPVNATVSDPVDSTEPEPVIDISMANITTLETDVVLGNDTTTESTPTESTPTESTPTESTPTESTPTESTPTEVIAISEESLNVDLGQLTVSAWIKPTYTPGNAEFTIVGKENSFVLGLNNRAAPEQTATFSVFNDISWSTATAHYTLPEGSWTHLVGVINGTESMLYQNGTLVLLCYLIRVQTSFPFLQL